MDSGRTAGDVDVLVVDLDGAPVAVLADGVVGVHQVVVPTPLPGAPPSVEGAVDVHGTVVPVADLRWHLGRPPRPPHPDDHLVVAIVKGRPMAFRVDRAVAVATVDAAHVHATASVAPAAPHVTGVVTTPDGLVLINDLDALVSSGEAARIDRLVTEAETAGGAAT